MASPDWDEIRTAYQVARLGTVSGAAEVLGVHHATVIRHIDALERRLGARLFQRHARGYTPTDAGRELLTVAENAETQFAQLAARIGGAGGAISGEVIVTALPGLASMIVPAMTALRAEHPALRLRYVTDLRLFRLEVGEAHVAIRAGGKPAEPDNVVQLLTNHATALYAARDYAARRGLPATERDFAHHDFIGPEGDAERAPAHRWLTAWVTPENFVVRSNEVATVEEAIGAGLGIGFLSVMQARERGDLVEVMPPRAEWASPLWLVTHVDLHRAPRVQAVLGALKMAAQACPAVSA